MNIKTKISNTKLSPDLAYTGWYNEWQVKLVVEDDLQA